MEKIMQQEHTSWIREELDRCCAILEKNMEKFGDEFPSACATDGHYRIKKNDDWTNGFWTGMLWIAYEYTGKEQFKEQAMRNLESFEKRLDDHFVLDHHDIGFLYSLSAGGGLRILNREEDKKMLLRAADVLAARFQETGGFIQAWGGEMGEENEYRLIIDSLLNLPLLYRAAELSGEDSYREKADRHYKNVIQNIVRKDNSTYHTFYFDPRTGLPSHGATHQGFSDESCWARGQAWAILGMPLNARISGNPMNEEEQRIYQRVVKYFEEHLPEDKMPYWDLIFTEGTEPRDSSALAIAACGMMETGCDERAEEMLNVLKEQASSVTEPDSEGMLLHGVYAYAEGKGVDEPNLWGDYFYMEALYRILNPKWTPYW